MTKDKLLFIHIPKCAGHSANAAFYRMFKIENVLKVWDPRNRGNVLASDFPNMPIGEITSYQGVTGHLYFPDVLKTLGSDLLKREFLVTTIVRDPVRQVLSLWNYINDSKVHSCHEKVKNMELPQFIQEYTSNQQCIFLSGTGNAKKALEMLDNHFDIVRPLKQFNTFIDQIASHFNKPAPEPSVKNKTGTVRTTVADVDAEILSMIMERNAEDVLLYKGVMQRLRAAAKPTETKLATASKSVA